MFARVIIGTLQSLCDNACAWFTSIGRDSETIANKEFFQHYGFVSRPPTAMKGITSRHVILRQGISYWSVADDAGCRITVEDGEVAIHTVAGDKVHIQKTGTILVQGAKVNIGTKENQSGVVTGDCICPYLSAMSFSSSLLATLQTAISAVDAAPAVTANQQTFYTALTAWLTGLSNGSNGPPIINHPGVSSTVQASI